MKRPSDLQTFLIQLFDYQKYQPSAALAAVCSEAQAQYDAMLSDDALSFVSAAGDIAVPNEEPHPTNPPKL